MNTNQVRPLKQLNICVSVLFLWEDMSAVELEGKHITMLSYVHINIKRDACFMLHRDLAVG